MRGRIELSAMMMMMMKLYSLEREIANVNLAANSMRLELVR